MKQDAMIEMRPISKRSIGIPTGKLIWAVHVLSTGLTGRKNFDLEANAFAAITATLKQYPKAKITIRLYPDVIFESDH